MNTEFSLGEKLSIIITTVRPFDGKSLVSAVQQILLLDDPASESFGNHREAVHVVMTTIIDVAEALDLRQLVGQDLEALRQAAGAGDQQAGERFGGLVLLAVEAMATFLGRGPVSVHGRLGQPIRDVRIPNLITYMPLPATAMALMYHGVAQEQAEELSGLAWAFGEAQCGWAFKQANKEVAVTPAAQATLPGDAAAAPPAQ